MAPAHEKVWPRIFISLSRFLVSCHRTNASPYAKMQAACMHARGEKIILQFLISWHVPPIYFISLCKNSNNLKMRDNMILHLNEFLQQIPNSLQWSSLNEFVMRLRFAQLSLRVGIPDLNPSETHVETP